MYYDLNIARPFLVVTGLLILSATAKYQERCNSTLQCGTAYVCSEGICQCPENMRLSILDQICKPVKGKSGGRQLTWCKNGQVINIASFCDYTEDCTDGSDEGSLCWTNSTCPDGLYPCPKNKDGLYKCFSPELKCSKLLWKFCKGDDRRNDPDCETTPCKAGLFQCKYYDTCLPTDDLCDGRYDCADGTDEEGCRAGECSSKMFACENGKCINPSQICNGRSDCGGGDYSDEADDICNNNWPCPNGFTTCGNKPVRHGGDCFPWWGKCHDVMYQKFCPGHRVRDDPDCNAFVCETGLYACGNKTKCLSYLHQCDGVNQCEDGSDERNCGNVTKCKPDEFGCANGKCVDLRSVCNGVRDCAAGDDDSSDESDQICNPTFCGDDKFLCRNGKCIRSEYFCNGYDDCGDYSDEPFGGHCYPPYCGDGMFRCKNGKCISDLFFCDWIDDCGDDSDEPRHELLCYPH